MGNKPSQSNQSPSKDKTAKPTAPKPPRARKPAPSLKKGGGEFNPSPPRVLLNDQQVIEDETFPHGDPSLVQFSRHSQTPQTFI
jgi:hypothetical protein